MPGRVLVTDDEPQIRLVLRKYLEADGFEVSESDSGEDALDRLGAAWGDGGPTYDAVLLDIGLPGIDGLEVLRRIRMTSDVVVILLTARAEELDTLIGLGVGADDYIVKPFSPREVVARVKTVLRRARPAVGSPSAAPVAPSEAGAPRETADAAPLRFPGLTIDPGRREIVRDGHPVELSALEFDLLRALAENPGRVFSRTQLLEKVWGYDFFGDERVVDVHIRSVRKALGDNASDPEVIGTVRGVGYKFLLAPSDARWPR